MLQSIEVRIEADFNRKHGTIDALVQAGEIGGQALWEHANSLGRQVDGRGPPQRLCIEGISSRDEGRSIGDVNANDVLASVLIDCESIIDFDGVVVIDADRGKVSKVDAPGESRWNQTGSGVELCRAEGFLNSGHDEKAVGIIRNPPGADQNVVRRITRMGRAGKAFENALDFIPGLVAHPGLDAVNDRLQIRCDLDAFVNEAFDGMCQVIAYFFALALPGSTCLFGRDLISRSGNEAEPVSFEEEIVL